MRKLSIIVLLCSLMTFVHITALSKTYKQSPVPEKTKKSINEEIEYDHLHQKISEHPESLAHIAATSSSHKIFTDVLWDLITITPGPLAETLTQNISLLKAPSFALADLIRLNILKAWPRKTSLPESLKAEILRQIESGQLDRRSALTLLSYQAHLLLDEEITERLKQQNEVSFRDKTPEEIQDLFFTTPDLSQYENGQYSEKIRLFMFCRRDRKYPCRLLLKDKQDQPVRNADGSLWNQPSLGLSKLGLPYNQRNGNTPSGVYTLDSVMPLPDKKEVYGEFRRLIVNFVPSSPNEQSLKLFLPTTAQAADWWKEGVVARDMGRSLLRIHGTGVINTTPRDPHHPLRPTFGCIMQREGRVDGQTYIDQRHLLDNLMQNLGLPVEYDSETSISGVLYVIDLNDQKRSVTLEDLQSYLNL